MSGDRQPTHPLFGSAAPGDRVAWRAGEAITLERLLRDAARLAQRLPRDGRQVNLCTDNYLFLVGLVAAVTLGQPLLLPPGRAPDEWRRLARHHPDLYGLGDGTAPDGELPYVRADRLPPPDPAAPAPPPPGVRDGQLLATLFTSGSTGLPQPHPKHWGSMLRGAELTGRRLGLERLRGASLLAGVPPQHMYGLETAILLPLRWGLSTVAERPLFGADIAAALARLPAPRILVTTPLQLRSCLADATTLPELAFILSATAPLPAALADEAERRYRTRVLEIYGSTETGAVATRRPALEKDWSPLPGISVDCSGTRCRLSGGHLPTPVAVSDRIEPLAGGRFRLAGRDADLVKIAGKRASLEELGRRLLEIEGVQDGVFFLPGTAGQATHRLACLAVAPGLTEAALLSALRDKLDPAFLPRPLLRVPHLPRNATGKLPRRELLALFHTLTPPPEGAP